MSGDPRAWPTDTLVTACLQGEPAAWEEFVARTQPVIATACWRAARVWGQLDPSWVEDLVQDTYTKVVASGLLAGFEERYPDALFSYLKVIAGRVAHSRCRARRAHQRGEIAMDLPDFAVWAASAGISPEDQHLLDEIERWVGAVAGEPTVNRDLLAFQLYYRLGMSAAAIASVPCLGLSLKGVESLLNRLTRQLREKLSPESIPTERERAAHGD